MNGCFSVQLFATFAQSPDKTENMPYIASERREELQEILSQMKAAKVQADGDLNYILFKYCKDEVEPSYNNYKNYCGELRQCATEIERRLLGPYEDSAMERNGDV